MFPSQVLHFDNTPSGWISFDARRPMSDAYVFECHTLTLSAAIWSRRVFSTAVILSGKFSIQTIISTGNRVVLVSRSNFEFDHWFLVLLN